MKLCKDEKKKGLKLWERCAVVAAFLLCATIYIVGLDSADVDEVCNTDQTFLVRINGTWVCANLNSTIANVTRAHGELYNFTTGGYTLSINQSNVPYHLTGLLQGDTFNMAFGERNETHGGTHLMVTQSGDYLLSNSVSFKATVAGGVYGFGIEVNNDPIEEACETEVTGATTIRSTSQTCILGLNYGDNVSIGVVDTKTPPKDVTIHSASLTLLKMGKH